MEKMLAYFKSERSRSLAIESWPEPKYHPSVSLQALGLAS